MLTSKAHVKLNMYWYLVFGAFTYSKLVNAIRTVVLNMMAALLSNPILNKKTTCTI